MLPLSSFSPRRSSSVSWATRILWVCLTTLCGWMDGSPVAAGALVETCEQQSSCLKVTMTEANAGSCVNTEQGIDCQYLVCVQLLFNNEDGNSRCPKLVSETLAYSCIPEEDDCQEDPTGLVGEGFQAAAEHATEMMHLEQQCQLAPPGTEVQFLFQDGSGACSSGSGRYEIPGWTEGTATCGPSTGKACSGTTANIGTECVWSFATPAACTATPAPRDGGLFGNTSPDPVPTTTTTTLTAARPLAPTPTTTTTIASGGATVGIRTLPPQASAGGRPLPPTTTTTGGGGRSLPPQAATGGRPLVDTNSVGFGSFVVPRGPTVAPRGPTDAPVVEEEDSPTAPTVVLDSSREAGGPTDSPLVSPPPAFGPTDSPLLVGTPPVVVIAGMDASPPPSDTLETREFGSATSSSVTGDSPTDPPFLSMLRSFGDANFTVFESNTDSADCLCIDDFVNVAATDYTLSHRSYPTFGNTPSDGSRFANTTNTTTAAPTNETTLDDAGRSDATTTTYGGGGAKVKLRKLEISEDGTFSYTDAAILYLGEETLEVSGTNEYYLNKVPVNLPTRIGDYAVRLTDSNDDLEEITVDFAPNGYLVFTIMKGSLLEYLRVVNYKDK